jgi:hypothetical protein
MSKTGRSQQLMNWFNSEKLKDQRELDNNKKKLISDIKKLKKEELFPKPVKLTLWQKIKILLLGQ